jgi:hypothetical protein
MSKTRDASRPTENTENTNAAPSPGPAPTRRPSPLDALVPRARTNKRRTAKIARSTQIKKTKRR